MSVKLLNEHQLEVLSLKGGCTGTSESTLVKVPHFWKSHVTAHIHMAIRVAGTRMLLGSFARWCVDFTSHT